MILNMFCEMVFVLCVLFFDKCFGLLHAYDNYVNILCYIPVLFVCFGTWCLENPRISALAGRPLGAMVDVLTL